MTRFGQALEKVDERIPGVDLPLMSVSQTRGVVRRSELTDAPRRAESLDAYKVCRKSDIVFNKMKIRSGAMGVAPEDGLVTYHYEVMRLREGMNADYLVYLMKSSWFTSELVARERGISAGGEHGGIRTTEVPFKVLRTIDAYLPDDVEQRAIADYLDREAAYIDTLIEEQERLIELLRERRAAVVSHATLEASEIRVPLRRVVDAIDCAHVTAEFAEDDRRFPVASIRECQGPYVDLSDCRYTTEQFFDHLRGSGRAPRVGDLLFVRNVSVGLVSSVAAGTPDFALGQETVLLRRTSDVDTDYLRYALAASEAQHAIETAMIGSTFRRINVTTIRSLPVAMPSIIDQRRIVAHLDAQTAKIDALIAEAKRFIQLSRERRAALITAAVTGQLDVRDAS